VSITESSLTTFTDLKSLTRNCEIADHRSRLRIGHHRSNRHFEYEYWCCSSVTFLSSSLFTIFCGDDLLMTIFTESRLVRCCYEDDMSAITTIPTKWSTLRDIFLTPPRDDTITSFTCLESHFYFIDEHKILTKN
jgi:hypothetical protein